MIALAPARACCSCPCCNIFRVVILLILFSLVLPVPAQEIRLPVVRKQSSQPFRPPGIPEGELPSSPEEQHWWDKLRRVGEEMRLRKGSDKAKKSLAELLREGQTKSYAPPLNESRVIVLARTIPRYTQEARQRQISGNITLDVE